MKQRTKRVQALSKLRLYRMNLLSALLNPVSESLEDRTAALIIATNLEHALEDAIASFFQGNIEKLRQRLLAGSSQTEGAISSFYAKSWMAHALGVFGPEIMDDLTTIIEIRNVFAHSSANVSFDTPAIAESCNFNILGRLNWGGLMGPEPTSPRQKYEKAGSSIGSLIRSITAPPDDLTDEVVRALKPLLL